MNLCAEQQWRCRYREQIYEKSQMIHSSSMHSILTSAHEKSHYLQCISFHFHFLNPSILILAPFFSPAFVVGQHSSMFAIGH